MESLPPHPSIYPEIIGVVVCLIFSAFFSATETALTTLSDTKVHHILEKHPHAAALLKKWMIKPSLILSTILIGNNLVNILASVLGANIAHHYLGSWADAAAVGIMTFIVLIFGEITPKTYAKLNPEKVAVPALFLLRLFDLLFSPLAIILSKFARLLVRLMGGKDSGHEGLNITEHEIEYLIKKGSENGVFEKEEQGELLSSVVEFRETVVGEIMIPRTDAHFLETTDTVGVALKKISEWGHSRIPVYEESIDNVKGILLAKSLVAEFTKGGVDLSRPIAPFLRKPVLFAPESQKINETLKTMQAKRTHMAVVVDEFGGTSGLITLEDILEELVGDIKDEVDKEEDPITKLKDNVISVDAHISIYDLEEELEIKIPDDGEYNSLGGFITAQAGFVPAKGYKFEYQGFLFRVAESDDRHVTRVEIRKIS
ncbi:MAG TPA: hemolysin family protein [bacterium]|nr:hemolysin family protein [bacterium]